MQLNTFGYRLDPATHTWTPLPHGPVDDERPSYLWTGEALLAYDSSSYSSGPGGSRLPGDSAVWDPTTNTWTPLPAAPLTGSGASVWTGTQLIEWGSMYDPSTAGTGAQPVTRDAALSFGP